MTKPLMPVDELPLVVYRGPAFALGGYGRVARGYAIGLDACGAKVRLEPQGPLDGLRGLVDAGILEKLMKLQNIPLEKPYVLVHHGVPPSYLLDPDAVANIAYTVFETHRCPSEWVPVLNRMNDVWVPSSFVADAFRRSGVHAEKIFVVPHGVDVSIFRVDSPPLEFPGVREFNFLSVFAWERRKGPDVLLSTYLSEFGADGNVSLTIHALSRTGEPPEAPFQDTMRHLARRIGISRMPPVRLVTHVLGDSDLSRLYASGDAFVLPTRGEGWGLPLAEAMACGLPVIATKWGGHLDFMNDENSYLIEIDHLIAVNVSDGFYTKLGRERHFWAEPSVDHLRRLMRKVFVNRAEARKKGMIAAREIRKNCSWEAAACRMLHRLADRLRGKRG